MSRLLVNLYHFVSKNAFFQTKLHFVKLKMYFLANVIWKNSKDKNRRRCSQGYQGDIGCPTEESSRTIVFHLVCQENIDDFQLRPCDVLPMI
jgi:hypothetical protein